MCVCGGYPSAVCGLVSFLNNGCIYILTISVHQQQRKPTNHTEYRPPRPPQSLFPFFFYDRALHDGHSLLLFSHSTTLDHLPTYTVCVVIAIGGFLSLYIQWLLLIRLLVFTHFPSLPSPSYYVSLRQLILNLLFYPLSSILFPIPISGRRSLLYLLWFW